MRARDHAAENKLDFMRARPRVFYELVIIPGNVFVIDVAFRNIERVTADVEAVTV